MNILIFGTGSHAENVLNKIGCLEPLDVIIGFLDNDKKKKGSYFKGKLVYSLTELKDLDYDIIVISSSFFDCIKDELIYGYQVEEKHIESDWFLLKRKMILKYKDSDDKYIINTLKYWEKQPLSIYNQYLEQIKDKQDEWEVFWDKQENMPYIIFEGKRMYYPRNFRFSIKDGKQYIGNLLYDQQENSPHLYIHGEHSIQKGDVLVDAGVCEGNFALRYIEKVSKAYLIESDPKWNEALKLTFKPFQDKVVFCDKYLFDENGINKVKLDSLVDTKVDFIKMDIEGAEVEALLGAKKVFKENFIKCSICAYHKKEAESNIRHILESYGYETSVSNEYMVFCYDPDIFYHADFRHGMVYGEKTANHIQKLAGLSLRENSSGKQKGQINISK